MNTTRTSFTVLLAAAAAVSLPMAAHAGDDRKIDERGEAELAELLDGRVAGEPVKCLRYSQHDRMQVVDRTALVFRDGDTLYVNRTNAPQWIDDFDIPVFRMFGSSLCDLDRVEWTDRSGIGGPVSTLGEFVPYRKADQDG